MAGGVEQRLKGSRRGHVVQEFFANSAHFPLANIFLEMLTAGPLYYLGEVDLYLILFAAAVQAVVMGGWAYQGTPRPLVGNLIGPLLYTLVELPIDADFFSSPNHLAYWGFALSVGLLQQARLHTGGRVADLLLLAEHLTRTTILLVMYVILEAVTGNYTTATAFFAEPSHLFVAIVVPLLGVVIGFASLASERHLTTLRATAAELRKYSEWLLGRELLSEAVERPEALSLQRRERGVLFMDIRGFTQWSEAHPPEAVVAMVNAYYEGCERVWSGTNPVKVKHTADELMLVYAGAEEAVRVAGALRAELSPLLREYGLGAGIGVHVGPLVEGLIGSGGLMNYDVLGDTANTAKRLCSAAPADRILLSEPAWAHLPAERLSAPSSLKVKGKGEPLPVRLLLA